MSKSLIILGSTGSIGRQALDVVDWFPEELNVVGLAAGSHVDLLAEQVKKYQPQVVAIARKECYLPLKEKLTNFKGDILAGPEGIEAVASMTAGDTVLAAISGVAGLKPVVAAIQAGKEIALANKETLVAAGFYVTRLAKENNVPLYPVDSEHSAIWQCLQQAGQKAEKLILTASGGPFLHYSEEALSSVTAQDALKHPTWQMGSKITIDSATLMNKGLEVIEAHWLFDMDMRDIDIVIHPQSIIHSMVSFPDGAILAQMGAPDMRVPIQYAFFHPKRPKNEVKRISLSQIGQLTFMEPDYQKFPCLSLALSAGRAGDTYPVVLNAANEELVKQFLAGKIRYQDIAHGLELAMAGHQPLPNPDLEEIFVADQWARDYAKGLK